MKEHALFPTLVCEFDYPDHDKFKPVFYEHIFKHMTPDGHSNEMTNHVSLHHQLEYAPFFHFAIQCVKQYTNRLHIDIDKFDFNVVKTWMNIKKDYSTTKHSHGDAHISFTYYVNIPKTFDSPIRFYNYEPRNEPYPGSIRWNNTKDVWDSYSAQTWKFNPKEGNLFVFPSSLPHDTVGSKEGNFYEGTPTIELLNESRVCLACDILLTYKVQTPSPLGIQPVENWRRFDDV